MKTPPIRTFALTLTLLPALLLAACGGTPTSTQAPAATAAAMPTQMAAATSASPQEVAAATQAPGSGQPLPAADAAAQMPAPPVAGAPATGQAPEGSVMEPLPTDLIAQREGPAPTPVPEGPVAVNPFTRTAEDNQSTFALDVDTAAYSAARASIESGMLPPAEAARVEEFVNSFDYGYPRPNGTFGITVDGAPAPFGAAGNQIVRVGIQGMTIDDSQRAPSVLTFVIDVSGSMQEPRRLPLVKESLKLLAGQLRPDDKVAIVAYGDTAFTVLEPTGAAELDRISSAIDSLGDRGSTNAEDGLRLGYEVAGRAFARGANNRVILCSDGVANVGATGPEAILQTIRDRAAQGIYLTTVGFGMGDYNDFLMEQLADDGNGSYAYVDDLDEARRIFVENLTGTLQVIAKDAKVQVVFNPDVVSQYRLLGYENRAVADADFRNDKVDAGEIGAGHSVTALYEVALTGQAEGELLTVQLRWADPSSGQVSEIAQPFASGQLAPALDAADPGLRLAAAVAGFAEILRGSPYAANHKLSDVRALVAPLAAERANDAALQELQELLARATVLRQE